MLDEVWTKHERALDFGKEVNIPSLRTATMFTWQLTGLLLWSLIKVVTIALGATNRCCSWIRQSGWLMMASTLPP